MIRVCGGGGHRELIEAILGLAQDSRWILRDISCKKEDEILWKETYAAHERLEVSD
jgi:hypothetical protein